MKTIWKVLGVTALLVGLNPYRVTTDPSTGDVKLRALLWKGTYGRRPGNHGLTLDFGFFPPREEDEPHLYADELVVHYHNGQPCYVDDEPCGGSEACCEDNCGGSECCCQASGQETEAPDTSSSGEQVPQSPSAQEDNDSPEFLREP